MLVRLALATVRARWVSFTGSLLALAAGVALVTTAGAAINAAGAAGSGPSLRFAQADLLIQADPQRRTAEGYRPTLADAPPLPADLVARVAVVPGVRSVVADRRFPVAVAFRTDGYRPWRGHGWSSAALTPYRLVAGRAPAAPGEVVLPAGAGAAMGARLRLGPPSGAGEYTVVGLVAGPETTGERPVFFADDTAVAVSGQPGRVDVIAIHATAGRPPAQLAAAVRDTLAGEQVRVLTGDAMRLADDDPRRAALDQLSMLLGMLAGLAVFVAVFVVSSTFAYAVAQRRREFALLRTIGLSRRRVARLVRTEALLVGLGAAIAGVLLAVPASVPLARVLVATGTAPPGFTVPVRIGVFGWPAAIGIALGVMVALAGAGSAVRRASRVSPLEALREVLVEPRVMTRARWIAGTIALAVGGGMLALLPLAPGDGRLALALLVSLPLVTAAALLAPVFAGRLAAAVPATAAAAARAGTKAARAGTNAGQAGTKGARAGAMAYLARANLRVAVRRTASVAAPMLVTVGVGASLLGVTGVLVAASAADARDRYSAPLVVLPTGGAGLSQPALVRVAGVPGVAATVPLIQTTVHVVAHRAVRSTTATGVDGTRTHDVLRLGRVDGDPGNLRGDAVAVARGQAASLGWRLGDQVPVVLADGQAVRLRVVALFDGSQLGGGILLPAEVARAHDPRPEPDAALVTVTPGADPRTVAGDLRQALAAQGATALPTSAWLARSADAQRAGMRLGAEILAGVALAYTLLAVVNTVLMAAGSRTGEFGRLRLAGAWRRQVLAMVSWEATGVTAVGVGLGALVTTVTVVGAWLALRATVPGTPLTVPWAELGVLAATCLALTLTTMLAATWLGLRTRPIDAIGTGE